MVAFSSTTTTITTGVSHSRVTTKLTTAAISRTTISRSWNCRRNARHRGSGGSSSSRFGPYRCCRRAASADDSPASMSTSSRRAASAAGRACQSARVASATSVMDPSSRVPGRDGIARRRHACLAGSRRSRRPGSRPLATRPRRAMPGGRVRAQFPDPTRLRRGVRRAERTRPSGPSPPRRNDRRPTSGAGAAPGTVVAFRLSTQSVEEDAECWSSGRAHLPAGRGSLPPARLGGWGPVSARRLTAQVVGPRRPFRPVVQRSPRVRRRPGCR